MNVIDMKRDHVVRATAANGTIRAFAVYSRGLVEDARRMHELSRTATAALGRTLTAAAMMGTMMKGDKDALSIVFNGDGSLGNITVTAKSDGSVKGYVGNPQASLPSKVGEKLRVGEVVGKGTLRIIYDLAMREPYSGVVEIQSGEIADDIAYYLTSSDQIPSAVSLGVLLNEDSSVREAGGFIVQLMDGATDETAALARGAHRVAAERYDDAFGGRDAREHPGADSRRHGLADSRGRSRGVSLRLHARAHAQAALARECRRAAEHGRRGRGRGDGLRVLQ